MTNKKYLNGPYSKWVKEDIKTIYKAQEDYLKDKNDDIKYYKVKKAIWNLSLTIKSEVVTGEISPAQAEELKEYFWGLLLL